ncbi:MAG: hypothetical protein BMS9Abin11_1805 [Gammaproteobacteria bacterium]|nr:MAG: hypothetical protein BMS9Abin11_1805 [Gammaproteobacteria bacterium]
MNPLVELQKLLGSTIKSKIGVILSNDAKGLSVSTSSGTQYMSQSDATSYKAGDKVQVQGQIVTGRIPSEEGIIVYHV